MLDRIEAGQ